MRQIFDDGWEFLKMPYDTGMEEMRQEEENFLGVELPHDWLIYDTHNLYGDARGWYRKKTEIPRKEGERILLYFEGVYMDTEIYVNGQKAKEWKYGYSSFEADITDSLTGGMEEILVSVAHKSPNTRWYSGAGIYRDVWIRRAKETHLVTDSLYISCQKKEEENWQVTVEAEITGSRADTLPCIFTIKQEGKTILSAPGEISEAYQTLPEYCAELPDHVKPPEKGTRSLRRAVFQVESPILWDLESPYLYEVAARTGDGEEAGLEENKENLVSRFGFRSLGFDTEKGFFLNGKHVKLQGVCEHHDFGCLGAAYSRAAMKRKFTILKEMGANALRTSHNMPAPDLMNLADEMGVLIISEAFDMWERPKTTYDYARFFREWAHTDVASWVRRDRNHPSLLMWSVGNEIYDTHADVHAQDITRSLKTWVEEYDPYGNAPVTLGSNFLPWENAQKCTDILKFAGYNYGEKHYEKHHIEYPDWYIYGSETASVVHSRGIYHFPLERPLLADDDEQCSALGNSTTSWGADSIEKCIIDDRDTSFSMGQFIWTGFDYLGEPTPYHTKNSYFGQIDTAGFPKDAYYTFQAEWTDYKKAPMIHIFPYWDFNPGQNIDVRICSNAPEVELFVGGESKGSRFIDHKRGKTLIQDWQIPYTPGKLEALAYDEDRRIIARDVRTSFGDSFRILLGADKEEMDADGKDMIFVEISTLDREGNPVENAVDYVEVSVSGAGRLVGLDNGDSTDYDSYKGTKRKLFQGKLLAVIASDGTPGEIHVGVTASHLKPASLRLKARPVKEEETYNGADGLPAAGISVGTKNQPVPCPHEKVWVRKIEILSPEGQSLNAGKREVEVFANVYPEYASCPELVWSAVTEAGILSPIAQVDSREGRVMVRAKGDGSFLLRCTADNKTGKVKLISQLEFQVEGLGSPFLNPYEFVFGGLYNRSKGEIGNGNEKGVSSALSARSQIGFADVDFGSFGSDKITIPIFALDAKPYRIEVWEGMADEEGSEKLADVIYQKPSIWNVYQEETYQLSRRMKGVTTLCLVFYEKVHIKGFSFAKEEKAFARLHGAESDRIYGDTYFPAGKCVEGIGNNVVLEYMDMDFGEEGAAGVTISGRTPLSQNTIHLRFTGQEGTRTHVVEFLKAQDYTCRTYSLTRVSGIQKVELVFLPGSRFDLDWIQFTR